VTDKLYEATKREVMSEHEEYKNADVPKEVWIQRNEYLHKHIDKLNEELNELRIDNKRLSQQVEDQLKQFRNSGSI
jgi:DNA-binding TFAR19-related protein (PDSD5 family)